jgi:hypothetical protein
MIRSDSAGVRGARANTAGVLLLLLLQSSKQSQRLSKQRPGLLLTLTLNAFIDRLQ